MRTTFFEENGSSENFRNVSETDSGISGGRKVKFPFPVKFRRSRVMVYREAKEKHDRAGEKVSYVSYRTYHRHAGKPVLRCFATFAEAREFAERTARELARNDQSASLSNKEAASAVTVRELLEGFRRDTGREISAPEAVAAYLDALRKLGDHSLEAAVRGYLATVATVRNITVAEAVERFLQELEPRTQAPVGIRAQL